VSDDELLRELVRVLGGEHGLLARVEALERREQLGAGDTPTFAGLNVGAATGAGTGEVRAPKITATNTGAPGHAHFKSHSVVFSNGGSITIDLAGLVAIRRVDNNQVEYVSLGYAGTPVHAFGDSFITFADSGSTFRLFWNGTDYTLKNSTGSEPISVILWQIAPNS